MPNGWIDARPGHPAYCYAGRKRRYPTEEAAQVVLAEIAERRNAGLAHRAECRSYQCKRCKGWHLTSAPVDPGPA